MAILTLQTALLVAIAFILGAIIGCLLHRFLGAGHTDKSRNSVPSVDMVMPKRPVAVSGQKAALAALPTKTSDDLKQISGIGPAIEARLHAAVVTTFAQIAAWTKADCERISQELGFKGRIEREDWVAQAKILAKGGETEFSRRVVKGDAESSRGKAKRPGKKQTRKR